MEGFVVLLLGALAVAASPLVPGVRPVAKSAVKGGLALGGAAAAAAAAAGQQWEHLAEKMGSLTKSEVHLPVVEGTATVVAEPPQATSEVAAAEATDAIIAPPLAETALAEAVTEAATEALTEAANEPSEEATGTVTGSDGAIASDDLTRVSGIGPKTAAVLAAAGIFTYAQLAAATEAGLREILANAGSRYRLLDPTTWPDQAGRLLAESAQ